jgi:hypothetical protein
MEEALGRDEDKIIHYRHINIIASSLADQLVADGYNFPKEGVRRFPDGSIWSANPTVMDGTSPQERPTGPGRITASRFRSIAEFGGDTGSGTHYTLWFPGWYSDLVGRYDECGPLTYPGVGQLPTESEHDIQRLRVVVRSYLRITEVVASDLAAALRQWYTRIASQGVFGEEGLRGISTEMHYGKYVAGFRLDARGSGQETLNTLYLTTLAWGMSRKHPLEVLADFSAETAEGVFSSRSTVPISQCRN